MGIFLGSEQLHQPMVHYYGALRRPNASATIPSGPTPALCAQSKSRNREDSATSPARPVQHPKLPHPLRVHPRKTLPQASLLHLIVVR